MPVQHVELEMHKVERILQNRKFGFRRHQAGFFQLTQKSATAFRSDGTPFYDPLPGMISPQVQSRILKYSRDENDAATHFIAIATQQVTDPVLADEPVSAPPMDMDAIERVAGTIAENKLAEVVAKMEERNKKQIDAVLADNAKLRKRIDELEGDDDAGEEAAAPKPTAKRGKKKGKGSWRKKQVAEPKPIPSGKPPEPPMDMGIG